MIKSFILSLIYALGFVSQPIPVIKPDLPRDLLASSLEAITSFTPISAPTPEIATSSAELGGDNKELDYTKQCVYYARQNSPFSPPKVQHAKQVPPLTFEPRKNYWSIYGEGCQYGFSGHNGVVSEYNLQEGWFLEHGRNLDGKGTIYKNRKVYFKGQNKDKCLLGFFGWQR